MLNTHLSLCQPRRVRRAKPSGISLTESDAAITKGMLQRGDRQHDIASYFGVDSGRISEVSTGTKFSAVAMASSDQLPEPGPYASGVAIALIDEALSAAQKALEVAKDALRKK